MSVTIVDNTDVSRVANENITVAAAPSYTESGAEEPTSYGTFRATIGSAGSGAARTWTLSVSDGTWAPSGASLAALSEYAKDMRDAWQQIVNELTELSS